MRLAVGAALSALVLSLLAIAAPAQAAVTGTTSSQDLALYPECQQHDVQYAIQVSSDTTYWQLELQVEKADDTQSAGSFLSSANGSPTSGTVQIYVCGSAPAGTWIVKGSGIYQTAGLLGTRIPYSLPDSTFTVRLAHTRTSLGVKQIRHQKHRVRLFSTVTDERSNGYGRTEGAPVDIERLVDGAWHKVRGSRERTLHGRTTTVVRKVDGATYRAVTHGIGNYDGSVSASLRLTSRS